MPAKPKPTSTCVSFGTLLGVAASIIASAAAVSGPPAKSGATIFGTRCAKCHGPKGEGTKSYNKPLAGSMSVSQLTHFIAQSMPPGTKKCTREDAKLAAAFVYATFYSPIAQARNLPPSIALSRLTVRQYRNAIADLVGSFRTPGQLGQQHGLNGVYFQSRQLNNGAEVLKRLDPAVQFDFGTATPVPGKADPHTFSMRWTGSVVAPDSGVYDFVVHSDHSIRLWVNDLGTPLIDKWVKSGADTDFHGSLFLVGGRAYPLKLEFSKSTRGVDDSDKLKGRPIAPASIALLWTPPSQAESVVPQRCLVPVTVPETFAVGAPFPPDDRSMGFERGTSVSRSWDDATTEASIETAAYVIAHLRELSGAADNAPDRAAKLRTFCTQFTERAFRRPLTSELTRMYVDSQFAAAKDLDTAVKRVVLMTLNSPRFLYINPGSGHPDSYDISARLSFGLWDSLPDDALITAASAGQLSTPEQVNQQALRMAGDERTWYKLRKFMLQWLKVDTYPDLVKDHKLFPGFDGAVAADLRTSLEIFLQKVLWSSSSDFRQLLLADNLPLNGRLAHIYGANLPQDAPFQDVTLNPTERAGILTHPYIMAVFAHPDTSSPIRRGVLITRNMLGRLLKPPPQAFVPLPALLHPDLTNRQRVELQTKPPMCQGCHGLINPIGFTLERFDAIGRLQTKDDGRMVDTAGGYESSSGVEVKLSGARDLAKYLTVSSDAQTAFVQKLFQYLVKQPAAAYGPKTLAELRQIFIANQFNVRKQMVASVAASAFVR